jgi:hypothetical protein
VCYLVQNEGKSEKANIENKLNIERTLFGFPEESGFLVLKRKKCQWLIYSPASQPTQNKIFRFQNLNTKAAYEFIYFN